MDTKTLNEIHSHTSHGMMYGLAFYILSYCLNAHNMTNEYDKPFEPIMPINRPLDDVIGW